MTGNARLAILVLISSIGSTTAFAEDDPIDVFLDVSFEAGFKLSLALPSAFSALTPVAAEGSLTLAGSMDLADLYQARSSVKVERNGLFWDTGDVKAYGVPLNITITEAFGFTGGNLLATVTGDVSPIGASSQISTIWANTTWAEAEGVLVGGDEPGDPDGSGSEDARLSIRSTGEGTGVLLIGFGHSSESLSELRSGVATYTLTVAAP